MSHTAVSRAAITGSGDLADDLLQESSYRFLRAAAQHQGEAHRRNSLFRIATNLARDGRRRGRRAHLVALPGGADGSAELPASVTSRVMPSGEPISRAPWRG
jgi:DNA-directed RNA polymerase specialized sigma24 family protein